MRVVHFDEMFHPDFGDQINILPKFQVKKGHEVIIVTGDSSIPHPRFLNFADNSNMIQKDREFEKRTGAKVIRIGIKRFISSRAVFQKDFTKIIDDLNPDILFCHFNDSLVGMYYIRNVKKLNYPLILDSHMLEMASKNKLKNLFRIYYRNFITSKIKKYKIKIIKTQQSDYVNKRLGVPESLTPYISFGTDTSIFNPNQNIRRNFRKELNIPEDDFVVVYTGKLNEVKGGKILAEAFLKKFNSEKNVTLITVGNISTEYEKEVRRMFNESQNNIINIPTQKYIDLAKFYQISNLSVFPKQCSLSFFDAQACGLPVIAEDNSINKERLSHNNGYTYELNNVNDLRNKITELIIDEDNEYNTLSSNSIKYIKKNFDYEKLTDEYNEIFKNELEIFHNK